MKKIYFSFTIVFKLLCSPVSFAQITLTSPSDRIVYQRDNTNQAVVTIAGYATQCMDQVEARFVPIKSNPDKPEIGSPTPVSGGWEVIQNTSTCGNFYGSMTVPGGWYRLEVRGIKSNREPVTSLVAHVGVGEVFLVAGQSNATGGDNNLSGPGAREDAVSSVNFRNETNARYSSLQLPCPEYVHLDQFTKTAPFGNYAWCWGAFGDKIVEKYNVPVMIFNAGWSASGIENWENSIPVSGVTTAWFGIDYPAGMPFGHLRIALNNYIAQLGIRAVLWHQGETDNLVGTSQAQYRDDLRSIINESRALSAKPNVAWLVSRASRYTFSVNNDAPASHTSETIIAAQNDVIGLGSHGNDPAYKVTGVFEGPETDAYWDASYRSDQVHFAGNGLLFLAQLWAERITDDFITNSLPYAAISPEKISITQANANSLTFTAPVGWNTYNWLGQDNCSLVQSSDQQWTAGMGSYRLKTIDAHNNVLVYPALNVSGIALPVTWKYFRGTTAENNTGRLEWATSGERNTDYFEIQRGKDASHFKTLAKVTAAGHSNVDQRYEFLDDALPTGTYYYRLKQLDHDGKYDLSRIISLKIQEQGSVKVFPNPVVSDLHIQSEKTIYSLEIFNAAGSRILSSTTNSNAARLDVSKYPSGLYTVLVNGKSFKIVK